MSTRGEFLTPPVPEKGESRSDWKRRRFNATPDYVREFFLENGHSDIPEGRATIGGVDARHMWLGLLNAHARNEMTPRIRDALQSLSRLGVILRRVPRGKVRENLAPPDQQRSAPCLQAIRSFAERNGHTGIPEHVVTKAGMLHYGVMANAWRRAHAAGNLSPWLTVQLESIPGWTWNLSEPYRLKEKTVLPPDTTRMKTSGLRQFLPED